MRKTKPRSSGEITFVAPFPLKVCKLRLKTKAERRRFRLLTWNTEVLIDRMNPETLTVLVSRGAAVVRGRLDKLGENSTQVTLEAEVDRFAQLGLIVQSTFIAGLMSVCALAVSMICGLMVPVIAEIGTTLMMGLLALAGLIFLNPWWALWRRDNLVREVQFALTDQILDVPNLSALDADQDGELVAGPPLAANLPADTSLDSLLTPKREPPGHIDR